MILKILSFALLRALHTPVSLVTSTSSCRRFYFEMVATLTRSSLSGGGSSSPRICVTMGPSTPGTMMVSPSRRRPLIRITSIVVPMPGRAFTWGRTQTHTHTHLVRCVPPFGKEGGGGLPHLHDLSPQLVAVGQATCQHGLGELHQQADQVAHPIATVGRGGHQRHKGAGVLVLVEEGGVETLRRKRRSRRSGGSAQLVLKFHTLSFKVTMSKKKINL